MLIWRKMEQRAGCLNKAKEQGNGEPESGVILHGQHVDLVHCL